MIYRSMTFGIKFGQNRWRVKFFLDFEFFELFFQSVELKQAPS